MARVSLILPVGMESSFSDATIGHYRRVLEGQGHRVEVLVMTDPRASGRPGVSESSWTSRVADEPGLAAAAVAGMNGASGDYLVVLDPERGYSGEDLVRVTEALVRGDAELVVASRTARGGKGARPGRLAGPAGALARRLIGSSDPRSGLLAMTRTLARQTRLAPVGSLFTLEVVVRADAPRIDVAAGEGVRPSRTGLTLDELRHLKRLADDRFGNVSRLVQFCFVGASGMVVDLSCYALLQWILSYSPLASRITPLVGGTLDMAVAGALAIALALTWNFSLNRRLTFSYARGGSVVRQFLTYALSNALGIALSFSLRLVLPSRVVFFHRHRLAAAVVGIVAATGISFSMSRWLVFSRRSVDRDLMRTQPGSLRIEPQPLSEEPAPHRVSRSLSPSACEPF